jgi:hypothetical protein
MKWDQAFERTQSQLEAAARGANQEIEKGNAVPLNERQL